MAPTKAKNAQLPPLHFSIPLCGLKSRRRVSPEKSSFADGGASFDNLPKPPPAKSPTVSGEAVL